MASGWDVPSKSVIRTNGRNSGTIIWDQDATAGQVIDSQGHDTNDQTLADSITETLNINGINAMLAELDFGTNKGINLEAGTAPNDAVTKAQLDAISVGTITTQTWDGTDFTTTTGGGNFTTPISLVNQFRGGGFIRHFSQVTNYSASVTLNTELACRFRLACDGDIALTINGPTGPDTNYAGSQYDGQNYEIEGQILITNSGSPGTITINGGTANVKGAQDISPSSVYLLSYIFHYNGGTVTSVFLWGT
jgi:hypothetical protein